MVRSLKISPTLPVCSFFATNSFPNRFARSPIEKFRIKPKKRHIISAALKSDPLKRTTVVRERNFTSAAPPLRARKLAPNEISSCIYVYIYIYNSDVLILARSGLTLEWPDLILYFFFLFSDCDITVRYDGANERVVRGCC